MLLHFLIHELANANKNYLIHNINIKNIFYFICEIKILIIIANNKTCGRIVLHKTTFICLHNKMK